MPRRELDHPSLPPFEPILRAIHRDIFEDGYDALRRRGSDIREGADRKTFRQFIRLCHRGFQRAQKSIAEYVLNADEGRRECLEKIRRIRAEGGDPAQLRERARVEGNRVLVLRSMADALAAFILRDEPWVMRRLLHYERPTHLERETVEKAVRESAFRFQRNRLSFALVTDLTNGIHVGDLLEVDFSGPQRTVGLIELKSGRVNAELGQMLAKDPSLKAGTLERVAQKYGDSGVEQIHRQRRQVERIKGVAKTLAEERGVDPLSGRNLIIPSDYIELDHWSETFYELVEETLDVGHCAANIQGALQVVMRDQRDIEETDKESLSLVQILILGMLEGVDELPADPVELAEAIRGRLYRIHDLRYALFANEFMAPWRLPHPSAGIVFDVLFGRLRVWLHLDPIGLIDLSVRMGLPLRWATRKERSGYSEMRGASNLGWFKKGLLTTDTEPTIGVGPGVTARVLFDFVSPSAAVRLMHHGLDEVSELS